MGKVESRPQSEEKHYYDFSFSARDHIIQRMNRRWTTEHERQLLELRATGLTWRAIAKKVGRSEASVVTRVGIMKTRSEFQEKSAARSSNTPDSSPSNIELRVVRDSGGSL